MLWSVEDAVQMKVMDYDVIRVTRVSTDKVGLWYYWNGLASINPKTSMGGIQYIQVVIDSQTQTYWKKFQMKIPKIYD